MAKMKRYGATRRIKSIRVACVNVERPKHIICLCGGNEMRFDGGKVFCLACKARVVVTDGPERMHDSILEWERSEVLLSLQGEGAIACLTFHPTITPFPGNKQGYVADAMYSEDGRWIYEDVKGIKDREWMRTVALWQGVGCDYRAPGVLREVTKGAVRAWVCKDYEPKGG